MDRKCRICSFTVLAATMFMLHSPVSAHEKVVVVPLNKSSQKVGGTLELSEESSDTVNGIKGAVAYCNGLGEGFRLPSAPELARFIGTVASTDLIWTGSPYTDQSSRWFIMDLSDGVWYWGNYTEDTHYARCVR